MYANIWYHLQYLHVVQSGTFLLFFFKHPTAPVIHTYLAFRVTRILSCFIPTKLVPFRANYSPHCSLLLDSSHSSLFHLSFSGVCSMISLRPIAMQEFRRSRTLVMRPMHARDLISKTGRKGRQHGRPLSSAPSVMLNYQYTGLSSYR